MNENQLAKVLIDNSAFAGAMRLLCQDIKEHKIFFHNYPKHRVIDQRSLADFLTAVVIYDEILLDSHSMWNDKCIQSIGICNSSWAEELVMLLPYDIRNLFNLECFDGESEEGSYKKAIEIMASPLKEKIELKKGERIPEVYFAKDYVYREVFDKLNKSNTVNQILNEANLAQAMFLHRGLYLQSRAQNNKCTYLPYHYRGKMLSNLPPLIWSKHPHEELIIPSQPLNITSEFNKSIQQLNTYYYSLIEAVTWKTYPLDIPFIGAALLSSTKGNPQRALSKAIELRHSGDLKKKFKDLQVALITRDRPNFEYLMDQYKKEFRYAAAHLGMNTENDNDKHLYKLSISLIPGDIRNVIESLVKILPDFAKEWGRKKANKLITKTSFQLLFLDHVNGIRDLS